VVNSGFESGIRGAAELPLYEYECAKCGTRTEKIEKFSGPHLKKCPKCGGRVKQLVSAPAVQFKGSGWYVTDYGRKTPGGDHAKAEAKETKDTKSATESKEKKEATKETKKPAAQKEK
jgi:putative FmdB family regulatory protein